MNIIRKSMGVVFLPVYFIFILGAIHVSAERSATLYPDDSIIRYSINDPMVNVVYSSRVETCGADRDEFLVMAPSSGMGLFSSVGYLRVDATSTVSNDPVYTVTLNSSERTPTVACSRNKNNFALLTRMTNGGVTNFRVRMFNTDSNQPVFDRVLSDNFIFGYTPNETKSRALTVKADGSGIFMAGKMAATVLNIMKLDPNNGSVLASRMVTTGGSSQELFDVPNANLIVYTDGTGWSLLNATTLATEASYSLPTPFFAPPSVASDGNMFTTNDFSYQSNCMLRIRNCTADVCSFRVPNAFSTVDGASSCPISGISENGSMFVAVQSDGHNNQIHVSAYDIPASVASGNLVEIMHDQWSAEGSFQNSPTSLAIQSNGKRFVVGTWGDGLAAPVANVYNAETRTRELSLSPQNSGSAFAVFMNNRGIAGVLARISAHANQSVLGASMKLINVNQKFDLRGTPHINSMMNMVYVEGVPGANISLVVGDLMATPRVLPYGTLYINNFSILPLGEIPASGRMSTTIPASFLATLGHKVHAQVAAINPDGHRALGTTTVQIRPTY